MDSVGVQLAILLWLLILGQGLVAARFRGRLAGAGVQLATWLVVTTLVVWVGGTVAFVVVHVLLFTFGNGAAWVGLLVSGACLIAAPIVVAIRLRQRPRPAVHGPLGAPEG